MKNKELTIKITNELYKELKATCLALKNVNVFGQKYKTISDEEISGLINVALQQKEFRKTLKELKEKAENGVKSC